LECRRFSIKESYDEVDDLKKIDALKFADEKDDEDEEHDADNESDNGDQDKLYYTCQYGNCSVPWPCFPCCSEEEQCSDLEFEHVERFEEEVDAVTVRTTEEFFNDDGFLMKVYWIKHPEIPLKICTKCRKDFLHHICYHINLLRSCKYCPMII
jgi:hypothetical protein